MSVEGVQGRLGSLLPALPLGSNVASLPLAFPNLNHCPWASLPNLSPSSGVLETISSVQCTRGGSGQGVLSPGAHLHLWGDSRCLPGLSLEP